MEDSKARCFKFPRSAVRRRGLPLRSAAALGCRQTVIQLFMPHMTGTLHIDCYLPISTAQTNELFLLALRPVGLPRLLFRRGRRTGKRLPLELTLPKTTNNS